MSAHHYQQLIDIFNQCFSDSYQTRLVKGDNEPIYLPKSEEIPYHQIIFAHGFYASALHEISHWCIAGDARRQQVDYGYWYCPDGRDQVTQEQFERVEIKPQALDWLFCQAANYPFNVSCDNLDGDFEPDRYQFRNKVREQVLAYLMNKDEQTNPHIVTRLDRNTSGLVLFAKFGHIHHLFSKVKFEKEYICLAYGRTQSEGVIEAPIARDNESIITRKVSDKGKYAKTSYYTIAQNNNLSLCKVKLHTGRTHQIRVHFQFMGHPIVGDDLYGGIHRLVEGQSLQCCSLKFVHPIKHNKITINVDYKQLIQLFNVL